MRYLKFVAILLLVCFLSVPGVFARFYLNPVDTSTSSWLEIMAAPGYEVSGEVVLYNGFEEATKFELAVVDAESTEAEDGFFALKADGSVQTGIGLWGALERTMVTLLSGESENLKVNFFIPTDTTLGEYWGGVTAMEIKESMDSDNSGLSIAVRNGLRIHLTVMSEEDYKAWLASQNSTTDEEEPIVDTDVPGDYSWLIKGGIAVLICAVLIALIKMFSGKRKNSK